MLVAKDARAAAGSAERRPIRELVHEGQRLLVQGVREPVDDKGARVTADVKLFGHALVHTPFSQPVEQAQQRGRRQGEELRERGRILFPRRRICASAPRGGLGRRRVARGSPCSSPSGGDAWKGWP